MKLCMIGTGYVGLVSGVCFSDLGNDVICVDKDLKKINNLKKGIVPIYEPGLEELVLKNYKNKRLNFSTNLKESVKKSDIVFICVGTPTKKNSNSADLSQVYAAAKEISKSIKKFKIIINKSTVPVTTGDEIEKIISKKVNKKFFSVVSNPEFLREGEAIRDFIYPDRVVVGSNDSKSQRILKSLYSPLISKGAKFVSTKRRAAELIKYASNAFLATKISFINEISSLCESVNADVHAIAKGMGMDARIGPKFLHPGPGYGGSCFPKDTRALLNTALEYGNELKIVSATVEANAAHQEKMVAKIRQAVGGSEAGKKFAVLGLTFKPETDDIRESPALKILPQLVQGGANIVAHDPKGLEAAKRLLPQGMAYCSDLDNVFQAADAIVILTEWNVYRALNFEKIISQMRGRVLIDLRNIYERDAVEKAGFHYYCVGR